MGRLASVTLQSRSPYSQSRPHIVEKLNKENPKDYEERTWKERLHTDSQGNVFIPAMAFKNAIAEVARFLSIQIPGKGKSTYTKHFEAGVMILQPCALLNPSTGEPIHKDSVRGDWVFVPADGVRGSGKRVWKCYPIIDSWKTTVEFMIFDDTITPPVFEHHLGQAGQLIGIGRWRPRNLGTYGLFEATKVEWTDLNQEIAA